MNDFELQELSQQVAGLHEVIEGLLLKLDCCLDDECCIDAEKEHGCCCASSGEEE